ncbi:MAG: VTT domain-containing protein [Acidiferrobacterales bacterium]
MKTKLLRFTLLSFMAAAIAVAVVYRDVLDAAALESWVKSAGVAAPLLFMAIYILATVLFLPGSVLTLAGGALFGPVWGTFYNLTGATIGATIAFFISRYLVSDWVSRKVGGRTRQLVNGVEAEGWRFVAFVRLVPLFPFNLLNYALGLTRINAWHYVITSYVAMLPGAIAYTYLGYVGREAIAGSEGLIQKGLLGLALLAAVAFLPRLIGNLRKGATIGVDELKKRLDSGEQLMALDVRTEADFVGEQGHIAEAVNIPLESLPDRVGEIMEYQERPVLILCRTDKRSAKAAQLLERKGFGDVFIARRGMTAWLEAGYPVEDRAYSTEKR